MLSSFSSSLFKVYHKSISELCLYNARKRKSCLDGFSIFNFRSYDIAVFFELNKYESQMNFNWKLIIVFSTNHMHDNPAMASSYGSRSVQYVSQLYRKATIGLPGCTQQPISVPP